MVHVGSYLLVFLGATTAAPSTNVACLDPRAAMYALFLDSSLVSTIAHRYSICLPSNVATTETYIDRDGAQWHWELCRRDGTIQEACEIRLVHRFLTETGTDSHGSGYWWHTGAHRQVG